MVQDYKWVHIDRTIRLKNKKIKDRVIEQEPPCINDAINLFNILIPWM